MWLNVALYVNFGHYLNRCALCLSIVNLLAVSIDLLAMRKESGSGLSSSIMFDFKQLFKMDLLSCIIINTSGRFYDM